VTYLEEWRARQDTGTTLQSDAQLAAYLATVDPAQARLDHGAHMTPVELRMIGRTK